MLLPLGRESRTWSSAKEIFLQQKPEVEKLADMKEANDSQRGEEATISVKILGSEPPGLEWPPVPAQQWYHIKARACNEQSSSQVIIPIASSSQQLLKVELSMAPFGSAVGLLTCRADILGGLSLQ